MQFLADLSNYEFLQRALITAILLGILGGVVGSFVVLRGLSLMADAISHAVLPGVAISYMLGINFFFGAFAFGIFTALGIGYVSRETRIKMDAAIGIVFSAFLALGVILVAKAQTAIDLTQILFGNVLAVDNIGLWLTVATFIVITAAVLIFYRPLLVATFDPTFASVSGVPVKAVHYGMLLSLTLVTVVALQTVGVLLVVALLVIPASAALLLTNRLWMMLVLAGSFGAISATTGLYLSFVNNLPSGAVVVLVATGIFILTFGIAKIRGALNNRKSRKQRASGNLTNQLTANLAPQNSSERLSKPSAASKETAQNAL